MANSCVIFQDDDALARFIKFDERKKKLTAGNVNVKVPSVLSSTATTATTTTGSTIATTTNNNHNDNSFSSSNTNITSDTESPAVKRLSMLFMSDGLRSFRL